MFTRKSVATRRVHVRVRALKDACVHTFWLTKTCLCITFNIWHHVCHQIFHRRIRNDVQPHELTYEPFSVNNFSHTKSCLRTLIWPTRRTAMRIHCEKRSLCATFCLTWTCPRANVLMGGRVFIKLAKIISYVCARPKCYHAVRRLRDVSCACSRTNRRVCAHFLSYEVISMRNVKHMTPCLLPNSPQTSRNDVQPHDLTCEPFLVAIFDYEILSENIDLTDAKDCDAYSLWKEVPLRNFLSYMDVFAWKFSHGKTCLYTTCHIISYVCVRPTCFHAPCRLRDVFMCVFAH